MKIGPMLWDCDEKIAKRLLGICFLMVSVICQVACQPDAVDTGAKEIELETLKAEEAQLRIEAETLSIEKSSLIAKAKDTGRVEKRKRYAEGDLELIESYIAGLNDAAAYYEQEIEIWRKAHRESLIGLKTPSMLMANGEELPNVTIHQLTDDGLIFDSNGQEMRMKLSELSEQVRARLIDEESLKLSKQH